MTLTEVKEMCEYMKSIGADRFKCGELEVHFGIQPTAPEVPVHDVLDEDAREQVLDDVKGKLQRIAKANDADLFYSV